MRCKRCSFERYTAKTKPKLIQRRFLTNSVVSSTPNAAKIRKKNGASGMKDTSMQASSSFWAFFKAIAAAVLLDTQ